MKRHRFPQIRAARTRNEHGFTLVELLIVIVILGILAGIVVFAVRGSGDKGNTAAIATDKRIIRTALEAYCAREGHYPGAGPEAGQDPMTVLVDKKYLSGPSDYHTLKTGPTGDGNCNNTRYTIEGPGGVPVAVRVISAADSHSAALTTDGTVWTWGDNTYGQLGNGTELFASTPVPGQVANLAGVRSVDGSNRHSMAVRADGTVWTWGNNVFGQLGDGSTSSSSVPVQVVEASSGQPLSGVAAIAGGALHSIALKEDGTVWTWGRNRNGQLGKGTTADSSSAAQVLTGVTAVAAGLKFSLALKNDGTVWAWGDNSDGQLGVGAATRDPGGCFCIPAPAPVSGLSGVTGIAGGGQHSVAVRIDGTVWAWGENSDGRLGTGSWTIVPPEPVGCQCVPAPAQVSGPSGAPGPLAGITAPGPLAGITAVAAGHHHSLAVADDGTVWAWGANLFGQLGDGTTEARSVPTRVVGDLGGITAAEAGGGHSLAIAGDGTVWAWGQNNFGQLGTVTAPEDHSTTPMQTARPWRDPD